MCTNIHAGEGLDEERGGGVGFKDQWFEDIDEVNIRD